MQDHVLTVVSRRHFLAAGGALLGSSLLARAAADRRGKTISIFHTTDLHGHVMPTETYENVGDVGGMARCATQIRRWRAETPDSLLVDIGDVYQGTPESLATDGLLMMDLFNHLGYDAWVLGNHDFDWGRGKTEAALEKSKATILTANLTVDGKSPAEIGGPWAKVRPWMIKEVGGFRIGLIGLITPGLESWLAPETLGGIAPLDPAATLERCLEEIRGEKPDAIVVLGHMGWRFQDDFANPIRQILAEAKDVDIYLGGHSHQDQPSWMSGRVLCSQANYHGIHCGRIDLTFDTASRRLLERRAFTIRMDSRFEPDAEVVAIAKPHVDRAAAEMKRRVCTVAAPIPGGGADSPLSALFCQAFAAALEKDGHPVDGVFHGTFSREGIAAGEFTVADCWSVLPYENGMVTAELTPEELAEIIAEDGGQRRLWPFGMAENGGLLRDGQPVAPGERLTIAFNSYDAQSGGRRLMRLKALVDQPDARRTMTGVSTRAALIGFATAAETLAPPTPGK